MELPLSSDFVLRSDISFASAQSESRTCYHINMSLENYFEYIVDFLLNIPFNVFDYIIFSTLALYIFEDIAFGLITAGISFVSIISAFFSGLIFYPFVSSLLVSKLSLTKGISDAVSFLATTLISFFIISLTLSIIRKRFIKLKLPKQVDMAGGAAFGMLSFFFIASFVVALLMSFPVSEVIKNSVRNSVSGRFFFTRTQNIEREVRKVFGGAIVETINFLTIKPGSQESVSLNFRTQNVKVDSIAEDRMLVLLNIERQKEGLLTVSLDERTKEAARRHAKDMLGRGYFSHYSPEGLSPFDRLEMAGIGYSFAGENLAFAPDVEIAMQGLMKSKGHRENIMNPNYKRVGIGVLDAGIFGKMFVQEFTD